MREGGCPINHLVTGTLQDPEGLGKAGHPGTPSPRPATHQLALAARDEVGAEGVALVSDLDVERLGEDGIDIREGEVRTAARRADPPGASAGRPPGLLWDPSAAGRYHNNPPVWYPPTQARGLSPPQHLTDAPTRRAAAPSALSAR